VSNEQQNISQQPCNYEQTCDRTKAGSQTRSWARGPSTRGAARSSERSTAEPRSEIHGHSRYKKGKGMIVHSGYRWMRLRQSWRYSRPVPAGAEQLRFPSPHRRSFGQRKAPAAAAEAGRRGAAVPGRNNAVASAAKPTAARDRIALPRAPRHLPSTEPQ